MKLASDAIAARHASEVEGSKAEFVEKEAELLEKINLLEKAAEELKASHTEQIAQIKSNAEMVCVYMVYCVIDLLSSGHKGNGG